MASHFKLIQSDHGIESLDEMSNIVSASTSSDLVRLYYDSEKKNADIVAAAHRCIAKLVQDMP